MEQNSLPKECIFLLPFEEPGRAEAGNSRAADGYTTRLD